MHKQWRKLLPDEIWGSFFIACGFPDFSDLARHQKASALSANCLDLS